MQERKFSASIILATFNTSDSEVQRFLDEHGWYGFRINGVVSRYSVEVPHGQEDEAKAILEQSGILVKIFDVTKGHPVRPRKWKRKEKERPAWVNE